MTAIGSGHYYGPLWDPTEASPSSMGLLGSFSAPTAHLLNDARLWRGNPGLLARPQTPAPAVPAVPLRGPGMPSIFPPAAPQQSGVLQQIIQALTGGPNPNLSAQENQAAAKAAMIQAGLAGMAAASQPGARLGQVLATMAGTGQQAAAAAQSQIQAQSHQRVMDAIVKGTNGDIDLPTLKAMFSEAVSSGDQDGARSIATVINAVEAAERARMVPKRVVDLQDEDGVVRSYLVDDQGNKTPLGRSAKPITSGGLRTPVAVIGPDGNLEYRSFNPRTGQFEPVTGADPVPKNPPGGQQATKAAGFLQFIPEAKSYIDGITQAPGRVEQALSDKGLREFVPTEQQQLQLAGAAMAEAWLRMTTGAAYNEQEFQNAYNLFVPRPGDRQPTLEMKKRNRDHLMDMLRTNAGALAGGTTSTVGQGDVLDDYFP